MVTTGGLLLTVTAIASVLVDDCESVTVSVIVCVPVVSASVGSIVPVPIRPEILDVHERDVPLRSPSSASVPVPLKVIVSPLLYDEPSTGAEIEAVGGALPTFMVIGALIVDASSPSVAVRVIEWVPADNVFTVSGEPLPVMIPSRLDVHISEVPERMPSSASVPEPAKVMLAPS